MSESNVAVRYAQALYMVTPPKARSALQISLQNVCEAFSEPSIKQFLLHPKTPLLEKQKLVTALELSSPLNTFLLLVMEKGRDYLLSTISNEFTTLVHADENKIMAKVKTAVPLIENTLRDLTNQLNQNTGKQVTLTCAVDPNIGGGMIIEMNGKVINASLAHSLDQMKKRLLAN